MNPRDPYYVYQAPKEIEIPLVLLEWSKQVVIQNTVGQYLPMDFFGLIIISSFYDIGT